MLETLNRISAGIMFCILVYMTVAFFCLWPPFDYRQRVEKMDIEKVLENYRKGVYGR